MMRRLSAAAFACLALAVACSASPPEEPEAEVTDSELRSSVCSAGATTLAPGVHTLRAIDARALESTRLPGCRTELAHLYRFKVAERSRLTISRVDSETGPVPYVSAYRAYVGNPCGASPMTAWAECASNQTTAYQELRFPTTYADPGQDIFLAVARIDGNTTRIPKFTVDVQPACGNAVDDDLECDDGGLAAGDGCSATCTFEAACDLAIPRFAAGGRIALTVPKKCRVARIKGVLPPEGIVVAEVESAGASSVVANVFPYDTTWSFVPPRPTSAGDPWLHLSVGPEAPAQLTWECSGLPGEACNAQSNRCRDPLHCTLQYDDPGAKTQVRIANAASRRSAAVSLRISRGLEHVYGTP